MKEKTQNGRKHYLYLPYVGSIDVQPKTVHIHYKGGEVKTQWTDIHSILFYGESCDIPQAFLEKCAFYTIPVIIHRRNMPRAVVACSTLPPDHQDILTRQIIVRQNKKKRNYITKKLLQAKFKSMAWLLPYQHDLLYRINDMETMIQIEAWHAKRYWQAFFDQLNIKTTRRENAFPKHILDAVSKFVAGIMLRWILYHHLSPYHGFLHVPTDYPALVYDLMEPYRGYIDKVVFDTLKNLKEHQYEKSLSITIDALKSFLDTEVYTESTRQIVSFQELLHGVVLALRAYLLGVTPRFIVPIPNTPNGGRPINAGFKLYGHTAGITNFWPETRHIAEQFHRIYYGAS